MADFSRGVLSLAGLAYFLMILVVMLYVSMALIGRRHWFSGSRRWLRVGPLTSSAAWPWSSSPLGIVVVFRHHDVRLDATSEQLSSLSPETRELIGNLETKRPVQIEAFISPTVPEDYVQTRLNLLSVLDELRAIGGKKVRRDDPRHRPLQRRGRPGRKTLRHRAAAGHHDQPRRATRSTTSFSTWR